MPMAETLHVPQENFPVADDADTIAAMLMEDQSPTWGQICR